MHVSQNTLDPKKLLSIHFSREKLNRKLKIQRQESGSPEEDVGRISTDFKSRWKSNQLDVYNMVELAMLSETVHSSVIRAVR